MLKFVYTAMQACDKLDSNGGFCRHDVSSSSSLLSYLVASGL